MEHVKHVLKVPGLTVNVQVVLPVVFVVLEPQDPVEARARPVRLENLKVMMKLYVPIARLASTRKIVLQPCAIFAQYPLIKIFWLVLPAKVVMQTRVL
jgi:hypothetical protein